jgi:co-chaperonin GroES (HSP10)
MNVQFKRVLVSREKYKATKEAWEEKSFSDEIAERTFTLEECGKECNEEIKSLLGKKIILSDTKGLKVKEDGEVEYFILPQETIMCEASN